jgi:hypothetical protein
MAIVLRQFAELASCFWRGANATPHVLCSVHFRGNPMTSRPSRMLALLCALAVASPTPSFAEDVAYTTAKTAAEAAYLTAANAAAAASITAVNAASAAYTVAATAATAAYATAATAAAAAYDTAIAAANTTAGSDTSGIVLTYTVATAAATAANSAAQAVARADYTAAMAAAQAALTGDSTSAQVTCKDAMHAAAVVAGQVIAPESLSIACPAPAKLPGQTLTAFPPLTVLLALRRPSAGHSWGGSQVERAYARYQAQLDELGNARPSLATGEGLFPAHGFRPHASMGTWSLTAVDGDHSVFCTQTPVKSLQQWRELIVQLTENGMLPANADCTAQPGFAAYTTGTVTVSALKILDRRNYLKVGP